MYEYGSTVSEYTPIRTGTMPRDMDMDMDIGHANSDLHAGPGHADSSALGMTAKLALATRLYLGTTRFNSYSEWKAARAMRDVATWRSGEARAGLWNVILYLVLPPALVLLVPSTTSGSGYAIACLPLTDLGSAYDETQDNGQPAALHALVGALHDVARPDDRQPAALGSPHAVHVLKAQHATGYGMPSTSVLRRNASHGRRTAKRQKGRMGNIITRQFTMDRDNHRDRDRDKDMQYSIFNISYHNITQRGTWDCSTRKESRAMKKRIERGAGREATTGQTK
ncbi:hypothetical protein EVG20_g7028 [Dentipellis fragilis]|uniref:Uncharacterized protein n=1 Tax=Dentipellis fragilis TaxID=205917 RepID=A0A4Y9YKM0_9AGAM|nr:hypothetical protein EVG20_g7028 [Dentipellis fragilis]